MTQISSIKPVDVTKPKAKPNFTFENGAYESYLTEGFEVPNRAPGKKEREFLSRVDLKHGKIKVQIRTMIRQLAVDYSTESEDEKEYITWVSDWQAKNYQEIPIFVRGHVEGSFVQQRKELQKTFNYETGETSAQYRMTSPRVVFNIPFTSKKVDEILKGEHPLGPDSINITKPNKVIFYGKFDGFRGMPSFRCADYTYEQFIIPNWSDFAELAIRPGGPAARIPIKEKPQFIA